jgi:hypothetical protein
METWEAFLLGVMVAYTPSLAFAALLFQRAENLSKSSSEEP